MAGEDKEILIAIKVDNTEAQKRIDEQTESIIDLKKANDILKKANKETKDGEKLTADQRRRNTEQIAKNSLAISEATKIRKNAIKSQQAEKGSLTNLRNTLSTLTAERNKNLVVGSKAFNKANEDIKKLTQRIKEAEQGGDDFRRSVGKYPQALNQATGALGGFNLALLASPIGVFTAAIGALVAVGRQAFNFFKAYEVVMSKVKATTGATAKEFDTLKESTIAYGESTKFTATEVAQLQLELSKLGFTTTEIVDATGAILDLAVATDSELGESAKVVAKTLNQFGLEASESTRVADVMAKSFVSSALDIEVFTEGMKNAGVASKAVGVDVEQTTAILAVLADNGVDASTAGTQLKNVFIELSDQGLTWEEAMTKINKSQNKLQAANDLFGKRAAIVSTVIAENGDKIDELSKSFIDATGSAKAMADIVGNNLQGDLDRLGSSWEGLIARGSALNKVFRIITTTITFVIDAVKQLGFDFIEIFSVQGILFLAAKRFSTNVKLVFQEAVLDSIKAIKKIARDLGLEFDGLNKVFLNQVKDVIKTRAELETEEQERGETAFERYKKSLTKIFKEEEDAQTAAKIKSAFDRNKITNLETEKDTEKIKKEIEKRAGYQKQKTFELELFRKTRDANEETDIEIKYEKLKEAELFKRDFLLQNNKLIETDKELIIEESNQKLIELDKKKSDEIKKNDEDLARSKNAAREKELKSEETTKNKKIALEKQVATAKNSLLNAGFALAQAVASKDQKLQTALAITQTVINTARGIMNAFASLPYPAAIPAAIGVAATGAAQIVNIKNASSSSSGNSGIDTGGASALGESASNVTADTSGADAAGAQVTALSDAISNLGLTVSVTEINDAQSNVQVSEDNSTI